LQKLGETKTCINSYLQQLIKENEKEHV